VTETLEVLRLAASEAGLDASAAVLLRAGENHIYRLPGGVVGRVARPGEAANVTRETIVARWLNANGISAIRPLDVSQPVVVGDRAVTFWDELPEHRHGSVSQVAAVLRRLHSLPIPPGLRDMKLAPFVRLDQRIRDASIVTEAERRWLLGRLEDLRARWASRPDGFPECVIHGDAWAGNVVHAHGLGVILLDLERCSVGPPEWDLASTAVRYTSFGTMPGSDYREYCATYGRDVTDWEGYELLRDIRELRVACYGLQRANDDPALTDTARHRLGCLLGEHGPRPWHWPAVG